MKFFNIFSSPPGAKRKVSAPVLDSGRLAVRKKQRLVDGYLWSENMLMARNCKVRDLSAVGAMVDLQEETMPIKGVLIPKHVILYLVPDQQEIDCEVTWRKDKSLGLKFMGKFRASTRRYG
jgi:hypothetical protein